MWFTGILLQFIVWNVKLEVMLRGRVHQLRHNLWYILLCSFIMYVHAMLQLARAIQRSNHIMMRLRHHSESWQHLAYFGIPLLPCLQLLIVCITAPHIDILHHLIPCRHFIHVAVSPNMHDFHHLHMLHAALGLCYIRHLRHTDAM